MTSLFNDQFRTCRVFNETLKYVNVRNHCHASRLGKKAVSCARRHGFWSLSLSLAPRRASKKHAEQLHGNSPSHSVDESSRLERDGTSYICRNMEELTWKFGSVDDVIPPSAMIARAPDAFACSWKCCVRVQLEILDCTRSHPQCILLVSLNKETACD